MFVTEDRGSIDTVYYKLGASDFKRKDMPTQQSRFQARSPQPNGKKGRYTIGGY